MYKLTTKLLQGTTIIDNLDTQFGFRQFYRKDNANNFELNGIKCNLRGDSINNLNNIMYNNELYTMFVDANSAAIDIMKTYVDEAQAINMNVIRFHITSVVSDELFTYCDQKGMMVIDEAPFWGTYKGLIDYGDTALNNYGNWVKRWVKARKNHPSVIMWASINEAWGVQDRLILMSRLRQEILSYDSTRPIFNDGASLTIDYSPYIPGVADPSIPVPYADEENFHYTGIGSSGSLAEIFNLSDIYSIYTNNPADGVPKGEGESLFAEGGFAELDSNGSILEVASPYGGTMLKTNGGGYGDSGNAISQAIWARQVARIVRGARYVGLADYRPFNNFQYCYDPIESIIKANWTDLSAPGIKPAKLVRQIFNPYDSRYPKVIRGDAFEYYKKSFSPVAVFDKNYDKDNRIGANPVVYTPGNSLTRTLLVYNDELKDGTSISVNWEAGYTDVTSGAYTKITCGSFVSTVNYGEHISNDIIFAIPGGITGSKWLNLKLTACKNGIQKFTETSNIGVINSIPPARIYIAKDVIDIGIVTSENSAFKHKIKLINKGGGLTENWTCTGQVGWLNLEKTSGNLRGEQEVFFTINPVGLAANTIFTKVLTFTGSSGSFDSVTIRFTTGP